MYDFLSVGLSDGGSITIYLHLVFMCHQYVFFFNLQTKFFKGKVFYNNFLKMWPYVRDVAYGILISLFDFTYSSLFLSEHCTEIILEKHLQVYYSHSYR